MYFEHLDTGIMAVIPVSLNSQAMFHPRSEI